MAVREKTEQVRHQIVRAADQLFYERGYNLSSFSDIAIASEVPRGNLNYHFKTKDEVLAAVIQFRVTGMREMLSEWDQQYKTPLERLQRFSRISFNARDEVTNFGCPMGTLNAELGKVQQDLKVITKEQFSVFEQWIKKQFQSMGCGKKSSELTMHLMVWTQGVAAMAYVHQDDRLIQQEMKQIVNWLSSLSDKTNRKECS